MRTNRYAIALGLIIAVGLGSLSLVRAQTFTTLYSFTARDTNRANMDGAYPSGGLILSNNTLYGTASSGGQSGYGTVFAINTDGSVFTNLHSFSTGSGRYPNATNSDGAFPKALILSGNTLYGTTTSGGDFGDGVVFAIKTDGTGFIVLHTFTGDDGAAPRADLVLSYDTLYGTAQNGGISGNGTVFKLNADGTGFTTLHSFTALDFTSPGVNVNSDGAWPYAGLILAGNILFGTTDSGGSSGGGTLFAVNVDGTGFMNLHSFTYLSDGAHPDAAVILTNDTLYGTESGGEAGSISEFGGVFKVNTDGSGYAILHSFSAYDYHTGTNSDGFYPENGLIFLGNTLYGTVADGGISGSGTVFKLNTDGTGFSILHSFTPPAPDTGINSDGRGPVGTLTVSGNTLYGTAGAGGSYGNGTIFSISLPISRPQLTITPVARNVILTWPTNAIGFTLQSTTNLASSAAWTALSSPPVIINGQNTVTNPVSEMQRFFRLSQ